MMPDHNLNIGEKLKNQRLKKNLSLEEVSRLSGISAAVISGIEEQKVSPPLGNIVSLAAALKIAVGELYGDSADSPFCIVRSDSRKPVSRFSTAGKSGGYSYESLGHQKQNRQMEPFYISLTPTDTTQRDPNQHAGEEIIFVLTGQVEVTLAGNTDILDSGDSIYFDSNLPHIVACHGQEPATIFAVIYAEKEMVIF